MKINPKRGSIQLNIRVYVTGSDGFPAYHVLHVGFFPKSAVKIVSENLDVSGLAFHSCHELQTGRAELMACGTWWKPYEESFETIQRTAYYVPTAARASREMAI